MEEHRNLGSVKWVSDETGGLSSRHIMRMVDEGKFPPPVRLTDGSAHRGGRIAFVKSEVKAWIASRIAERDAKAAARNPRPAQNPPTPPHSNTSAPVQSVGTGSNRSSTGDRPRRRAAAQASQ
jgi:predicted DNA-binding transcriptional regulator AlpA